MGTTILPEAIILTEAACQCHGHGVYCGLGTDSEVFIIDSQLYSCLCSYNAIFFIILTREREVLQERVLRTPHTPHYKEICDYVIFLNVLTTPISHILRHEVEPACSYGSRHVTLGLSTGHWSTPM